MRNEFELTANADQQDKTDKIKVAAFLSPHKQGWSFTGVTKRLQNGSTAVEKPRETGFGIVGYQIIEVSESELIAARDSINNPASKVEISQDTVRYIYRESEHGHAYPTDGKTLFHGTHIPLFDTDRMVDKTGQEVPRQVIPLSPAPVR